MNRRRSLLSTSKISVPDNYCIINAYAVTAAEMFFNATVSETFTLDISNIKTSCPLYRMFNSSRYNGTPVVLNILGDTSKINNFDTFLVRRNKLETINGVLDFSNCTKVDRPFLYCGALKNITIANSCIHFNFDISYTAVLTTESVQSVVDGLADITGSASYTVTFNAKQPITRAQADSISAKGWTLSGGLIS